MGNSGSDKQEGRKGKPKGRRRNSQVVYTEKVTRGDVLNIYAAELRVGRGVREHYTNPRL